MTEIQRRQQPTAVTTTELSPEAREALAAGRADSTRRAYREDRAAFLTWCAEHGHTPLPAAPQTLIEYATHLTRTPRPRTGRPSSPSSISRALSAISTMHAEANVPKPETKGARLVVTGYRDRLAKAKDPAARSRQATAAVPSALRQMLAVLDRDTLAGKRDAALLLLGYAAATRSSELVALDIADLVEKDEGIEVPVYRQKLKQFTDSAIPYGTNPSTCPVRALRALVTALADEGRTTGPLFVRIDRHGRVAPPMMRRGKPIGDPSGRLTADAASDVIERIADAAGLQGHWRGHSLRRGFATASFKAGHNMVRIARQGGWADNSTALHRYFEEGDKWEDNPVAGL
ncbi:tyrosine-type recombinase/integrase [Streptomyces cucumeris]|uniref:tyrosine-type recombinase/integrase n=1 Tax=Streptomyces cucumeris TaxID=2962890 RepID=UPI003D734472